MHLLSRHGLENVRRYTPWFVLVAFVLLLLVLIPGFGVKINGARRWLGAGPLQFQPSELMKLALVLHAAAVLSARPKIARSLRPIAGPVLGVGGAAVLLIMAQPDLGTEPRHLLHDGRDAGRGRRADAPARAGGGGRARSWCCCSRSSSPTGARG